MKRKLFIIIISSCCIIALALLVFSTKHKYYPSVIDDTCIVASNIDFSVDLQTSYNDQKLVCVIENFNHYEITYGAEYYIEKEKDGKWYEVVNRMGKRSDEKDWNALAYALPANGCNEFVISLNNYKKLSSGNYRIVKYINWPAIGQNTSSCNIIVAPFQVK